MPGFRVLSLATCLLGSVAPAAAPDDLAKLPRTVAKEPAYQTQPRYCLLAFGPEAKARAWLVLDGETLYVDRQGTGDLTRPDCRVTGQAGPSGGLEFVAGDLTL